MNLRIQVKKNLDYPQTSAIRFKVLPIFAWSVRPKKRSPHRLTSDFAISTYYEQPGIGQIGATENMAMRRRFRIVLQPGFQSHQAEGIADTALP